MNEVLLVLSGGLGAAVVTSGASWLYVGAQRRKVEASAAHEEAETDSVIVTTTDRLVSIVNSQIERVATRVLLLERENDGLRTSHERCESDLRSVSVSLRLEQQARTRTDLRLTAVVEHSEGVIAELREQVDKLSGRVDTVEGDG